MADVPHDVFDHDHSAVHDHSKIESAQRKKICRNLAQIEPNRGEEQGERNCECNDERCASVSEKEEEYDRYQDHPFRQIVLNCVQRVVEQVGAIQHWNNFHARRQDAVI